MAKAEQASGQIDAKVLLPVLEAYHKGDFSVRMPNDWDGMAGKVADRMNDIIEMAQATADEFDRVAALVGKQGRIDERVRLPMVRGSWQKLVAASNSLTNDLVSSINEMIRVVKAVTQGDLSQTMPTAIDDLLLQGRLLKSAHTVNTMVHQLSCVTTEVSRVTREVGTEGNLGGQANLAGMAGAWRDLAENVNAMAAHLTSQIRNIAQVTTAVAQGDLSKTVTVEARGEILQLKDTVNSMVAQLSSFASEVTRVAREVGTEGKLGGHAEVVGVAGTWKDLTDNVNRLVALLTTQVRAIADVVTSVIEGDLTPSIQVEAQGEVADLRDHINEMICNLRETTQKNADEVWLKSNLVKFAQLFHGQRDLVAVSRMVLSELGTLINVQYGVFYLMEKSQPDDPRLKLLSTYGVKERTNIAKEWKMGEGLVGQCAFEKRRIHLTNVPSGYIEITSGLGHAKPLNIMLLPVLFEGNVKAVIEIASFTPFSPLDQTFLNELSGSIGIVLNTIRSNMRTEALLKQSRSLAAELGSQQEELRQTNEELAEKARLLEEQKAEVERKNREVETAKGELEENAKQLMQTSKYKSEFLSNMSHELRTPLNSLLILAQQLAGNPSGNLDARQVEYAKTIESSGKDLLIIINDILDLSKIESGIVTIEAETIAFADVSNQIERTFHHMASNRHLSFSVELDRNLPETIVTDIKLLMQALKNLLSNAFKFTEQGSVTLRIEPAEAGWSSNQEQLNRADSVIGFYVIDTGIGISADYHRIIFEAFHQADTGTARKYGGTGLGLSICRESARLLGGEVRLISSEPGRGSTFALFLPLKTAKPRSRAASRNPDTAAAVPITESLAPVPQIPSHDRLNTVRDDRASIKSGDRVLLIVDDDPVFANTLLQMAHDHQFMGIVAQNGSEAIQFASIYQPTAITLDLHLPDIDGWVVLEKLKRNPDTRHIPVEIISVEDNRARGLRFGAFEYLIKPVTAEAIQKALANLRRFTEAGIKDLLLADGNEESRKHTVTLIGNEDVRVTAVTSGKAVLVALKNQAYDCIVLGLNLPDISAASLIETILQEGRVRDLPMIIYGLNELPAEEQEHVRALTRQGIVKEVSSSEDLLDETALFLHRAVAKLPPGRRKMSEPLYTGADSLSGKTVLVVDDDVRNIFALTAALERHGLAVLAAENGKVALDVLNNAPDVNLVLMDIMMPEMDGYETMQRIRAIKKYEGLPIIALTAKAMKGDREKCLEAGASDYVAKPVNMDKLLSLLRVWSYK